MQRLGVCHRVHFLGPVPYSEMPSLYAQSDLFAICSTTEVKPLVVLEALASGLPVLAVAACGTQDTLTDGFDGFLCDLDYEQYSRAWRRMANEPGLRAEFGENATITASAYSIETYLERLCCLYQETVNRACQKSWKSATG